MKKPGFIITETIFSLVLAASVAAVAVLAVDLNTNLFHIDKFNPFSQESSNSSQKEKTSTDKKNETSAEKAVSDKSSQENVQDSDDKGKISSDEKSTENSEKNGSEQKTSDAEASNTAGDIKILPEPQDLNSQPTELVDMLTRYGYTIDGSIDGNRIIMIDTTAGNDKTKAVVYCYQQSANSEYWWNIVGEGKAICEEAYIGENGSDFDPAPDSKITPGGTFRAGSGFYINDKPDTTYPLFQITEDTYWVTDPDSEFYNQQVEGTEQKDWSKADHMITSDKSYKYGLVINFNTEDPDKEKASAVFMQCGSSATEGSIAVPQNVMKTILEWLSEDSLVSVFITI